MLLMLMDSSVIDLLLVSFVFAPPAAGCDDHDRPRRGRASNLVDIDARQCHS